MNTCDFDAALLDQFLDGALSPDRMAEVQAHLDHCAECRAYVDDVLAMREFFPEAEDAELPENFTAAVMAEVARTPQSQPRKQPWGKMAVAAACLALIALVQQVNLPTGKMTAPAAAPMEFAAASMADAAPAEAPVTAEPAAPAYSEACRNGVVADAATLEETDLCDTQVISVSEKELGEIPESLEPSELAPGYTCYLLGREDAFTAILVERGFLPELPADGDLIRLEVRSE